MAKGPKERRAEGLFLVEGPRGLHEALVGRADLVWVLVAESSIRSLREAGSIDAALAAGAPVQPVQDALFERLAPSRSGAGALAACSLPPGCDDPGTVVRAAAGRLVVATWGIQDPGNLGAVIRSARAFGAGGLISFGGADPWSPKTVRGTAGAIHTLAVARSEDSVDLAVELFAAGEGEVVAATPREGERPDRVPWDKAGWLVIGPEVAGLPPEIEALARIVTIETGGRVESLSAPIAASILLHEFAKGTA